ncbi:MAG: hypothetical protein M3N52_04205 [Actinomycetota bacterium]|nr:hypothetical protein [Actinomycetota bacterium]
MAALMNWVRGAFRVVSVWLALAVVVVGAAPASALIVLIVVLAPQQTVEVDGGTGRFAADIVVEADGRAGGRITLATAARREVFHVEDGRISHTSDGRPVAHLEGTVQVLVAGRAPTTSTFTARVSPSAEIEECLIFDLAGSGVSRRVEAEGSLRLADAPR